MCSNTNIHLKVALLGFILLTFLDGNGFVDGQYRRSLIDALPKYGVNDDNDNFDTSRYKFAYGVEDHKTGDFKMHQEERDGDVVKGEYTVADADGTLRTVKYTADKINGFHAVISKAGDHRQEVIPRPAPLTAQLHYQRPIKTPPTPSNHYVSYNREDEGARYAQPQLPIKQFIQELPKMARYHAARHNRVVENFAGDNAAHYQSINIDNNKEQTHYTLKLNREEKEEMGKNGHYEHLYRNPVAFNLQTPQGFRKVDDSPVTMPLTMNNNNNNNNEDDSDDGADVVSREEPQWKQFDPQGTNDRRLNNYKHIFDSHFGQFRRPQNDHGAFSYMNYEGESSNGYELEHPVQRKKTALQER